MLVTDFPIRCIHILMTIAPSSSRRHLRLNDLFAVHLLDATRAHCLISRRPLIVLERYSSSSSSNTIIDQVRSTNNGGRETNWKKPICTTGGSHHHGA